MSSRVLPVALGVALLAACRSGPPPLFESLPAERTGITFVNRLTEDDSVLNPDHFDYLYNGGGVGVGDFDADGRPDLFFGGNLVSSRLYLNGRELRFRDVTEEAGLTTHAWITGVSVVDVNQDGRPDLYLCVGGPDPTRDRTLYASSTSSRANLLFVNRGVDARGVPHFEEAARRYGITGSGAGYSTQAVFFDYDRDGRLDLYLLTNAREGMARTVLRPKRTDGSGPSTDRLYHNEGNGRFRDVSTQAGITLEGYGLGVAMSDLNQDGWPDLYVSNDFLSNDLVWINDRDGTFTDRAAESLKHQSRNGMGNDVADVNGDGRPDLLALDMLPPGNYRQKMMIGGSGDEAFRRELEVGYEPQYLRNTLQVNDGPGPDGGPRFSDVAQMAGVAATDWSWAPLLADFDNDGRKDLFVSNGFRRDITNLDYAAPAKRRFGPLAQESDRERFEALRRLPEVRLSNYLFRNEGELRFRDVSRRWGIDVPGFSNGAAYVDLDGDGDLDLVVNRLDGSALIYENHAERLPAGTHNWLEVRLRGARGNLEGIGAKVIAHHGGREQYLEESPVRGFESSVDPRLHFGLGRDSTLDSLEVYWPDGAYSRLTDVPVNRVLTVDRAAATGRREFALPAPAHPPRFRSVRPSGLRVRHEAHEPDDSRVTPLLPRTYSQDGPGIAVGDVDGNGLDDVYLGTDRGQPKVVRMQDRPGHFVERPLPGEAGHQDMGALFFDADGDGRPELYLVSGGDRATSDGGFYQDRLYVNDGRGHLERDAAALPPITDSGSCVVAADYDRDGRMDLFVCGHVSPGRYPLPPRSHLLRNVTRPGGPPRFTDVTDAVAPGLARVGMVSGALWSDYDGDGFPDLMLVGEWMPITLFHNDGRGGLANRTDAAGLGRTNGWWNGIVGGDFNEDGRTDYVVGNLGLNSMFRATPEEPVRVHAADFDGNGTIDPVLSRYVDGKEYPIATRDQLTAQMRGMVRRFPTYDAYARATLDQTLTRGERGRAFVGTAYELASSYLENLGGGRFALHPLPRGVQVAPLSGMRVVDCDGDGRLDVLLVGNSHAPDSRIGRYDALNGGVLLGDGRGHFRYRDGGRSGFHVGGDARALAEVGTGEGRSLFLVTQNDDSLRTFTRAAPATGRSLPLRPDDAYALITLADGATRREEFHYGNGYLAQSSRSLEVPPGARRVVIVDARGRRRRATP